MRIVSRYGTRGWLQLDVDAEAPLHALHGHLDVHLAHARQQLLSRLFVAAQDERLVLLGEPPESLPHLLLVPLRLGRDREAHDGLREVEARELDRLVLREEQIAGCSLLQLRDRPDVAGFERLRRGVILALELQELADPLLTSSSGIH